MYGHELQMQPPKDALCAVKIIIFVFLIFGHAEKVTFFTHFARTNWEYAV
jgi:hypothetical protein